MRREFNIACEQALLFGRANRAESSLTRKRERAAKRSESREKAPRSRVLARLAP